MKQKTSNTRVFPILSFLSGFVALMCMFANLLNSDPSDGSGNVYVAMFGMKNDTYQVVVPLVIAFCLLLLLCIVSIVDAFMPTHKVYLALTELALGLASGILFFNAKGFYESANGFNLDLSQGSTWLGAGSICVIVFSFIGAAFALLGILSNRKKD